MKRLAAIAAPVALLIGAPAAAQQDMPFHIPPHSHGSEERELAELTKLMEGLFTAEPLTAEQEARVPLAGEVVAVMTPPGFYAEMMDEMMSGMVEPMFGMLSGPLLAEELLTENLDLDHGEMPELTEEQSARVVALFDPAALQRTEAITGVLTRWMYGLFRQVEEPLRDGFTKAFATRFTADQLRDLQAFFATPTGRLYAEQTFSIYADPQVMQASLQMMPAVMGDMAGLTAEMTSAMTALPPQRSYRDLSKAEREELAGLLGMSERKLSSSAEMTN